MTTGSILVENVGKRFRRFDRNRPVTLKEVMLTRRRKTRREPIWSLRGVSFSVEPGRAVGLVGRNGAGKSTLLRIIGGVIKPNEGSVRIKGRIGALLEISAGLTDEMSGRENIYLLGVIGGMTRAEVDSKLEAIIAFTELGDAVDRVVRTYSTGMKMRLAFAVAVHVEPDVLLIDEVLAVGDAAFQSKCFDRIRAIKDAGCTIFLVSHDAEQIRSICDEVVFLKDGQVVAQGPTDEVMAVYESGSGEDGPQWALRGGADGRAEVAGIRRSGSREVEIERVELLDASGKPASCIHTGAGLQVRFSYRGSRGNIPVVALAGISSGDSVCCLEVNSWEGGLELVAEPFEQVVTLAFEQLDLAAGTYHLSLGLFSLDWQQVLDSHEEAYSFGVVGPSLSKGFLLPRLHWSAAQEGRSELA